MFEEERLTPEELKLTALQFMGQHLTGDLKELNKNIVSQNRTLQGMTLNPAAVINTIAPGHQVSRPPQHNPYANVVNAGINAGNSAPIQIQQQAPQVTNTPQHDPNQLEFDFNNSNLAKQIFDKLESICTKLEKVISYVSKDNG